MPDPFDFDGETHKHIAAKAGDPALNAQVDQTLAETLDIVRHAQAFFMVAIDGNGKQIHTTMARGLTVAQMLNLFAEAEQAARLNQVRIGLETIAESLAVEEEDDDNHDVGWNRAADE